MKMRQLVMLVYTGGEHVAVYAFNECILVKRGKLKRCSKDTENEKRVIYLSCQAMAKEILLKVVDEEQTNKNES